MFQGSAILLVTAIWYASITQIFVYAYNFNNVYTFCVGAVIAYYIPSFIIRYVTEHYHNIKHNKFLHHK
jgi:uncharacterized membrane protein